ncbi:MAG: helix-turn-helix domain-containing protein [Microbacteriaceae bacterium]
MESGRGIPEFQVEFGSRIKRLRTGQGWTSQERFAHHVGIDRTYMSSIEQGRRNPSLDIILKLAAALDVNAADLVRDLTSE